MIILILLLFGLNLKSVGSTEGYGVFNQILECDSVEMGDVDIIIIGGGHDVDDGVGLQ